MNALLTSRSGDASLQPAPGQAATAPPLHELASVQQVIWLDQMLAPQVPSYNLGTLWRIEGEFDHRLLESVLNELAASHDALRLVMHPQAGMARQQVLPHLQVRVPLLDFSAHADARARAQRHAEAALQTPFTLHGQPLWEAQVLRVGPDEHWWLQRWHHLVGDGTSAFLLYQAVWEVFQRRQRGDLAPLPAGPSYLEFLEDDRAYIASPRYQRDAQFWAGRFAHLPAPLLPVADAHGEPQPSGQASLRIDRPRFDRIKQLAEGAGCSLSHFLLALLAAYFSRAQGVGEVVIGVPVHNRGTARLKAMQGTFSSLIPVGIEVAPGQSFMALMQAVAAELKRCYRHQRYPVADINRGLKLAQLGRKQLFDVTLALEEFYFDTVLGGRKPRLSRVFNGHEQTPMAACLVAYHPDEDPQLVVNHNTAAISEPAMAELLQRLDRMIDAVLADGGSTAVPDIEWMAEAEREQVLRGWNDTAVAYEQAGACLHELVQAQVQRSPGAVAVVSGDERLSYAELNARANRLARHLRTLGVGPDRLVGVCQHRSLNLVVSLLATLKAGGAYVPLDPDYPAERLQHMLADSAPVVVLVDEAGRRALPEGTPLLDVADDSAWGTLPDTDLDLAELTQRHLAYVIYTSGSTGKPKGAMNEHRGVVNRLLWMQQAYGLDATDVVLQKTPFSFDVSVWEFFWPLMTGAKLVMARPEGHKDPAYLAGLVQAAGVTTLHFVPSMLQVFLAHEGAGRCSSLKRVVCSGEALPITLARACMERLPQAGLHNLYGPTEAAVDVTAWTCQPGDTSVPIGRPIANTQMYVLDEQRRPVPAGVAGELYIGGVQVGRGYLNRAELSAERFVRDPFSTDLEARLYKTGDLGRWRADGAIEYLGRNDFQVKIRGLRIELGEIESRLAEVPGVQEAVVLAREDQPGDQRLVAYITGDPAADALRAHAEQHLPAYMVPAAYVVLQAFPLSPNGKLDRKALPAPDGQAYASRAYEAPQGEVETTLAALWQELLNCERVGRHDNFFQLGGHSLLAVQLIERLRRHGLHADVRLLFGAPTLAQLAAGVGTQGHEVQVPPNRIPPGATCITPEMLTMVSLEQAAIDAIVSQVEGGAANVQDIYPLAPLQEGILFHHLMAPQHDPYLLSGLLRFDSRDQVEAFVAALQQVVDRHDILRTAFAWEGLDQPVQVVQRQARLPVDWLSLDEAEGAISTQLQARRSALRMDLRRAPLVRCQSAHDAADGGWWLHLLFHHLVLDHTTLELVFEEAQAIVQGRSAELPAPAPFRTFVAQARGGVSTQEHEAFFRRMLADIDEPTAPFGLQDVQGSGDDVAEARLALAPELAVALRACARQAGVSVASLVHLAWAMVLSRASGREAVVFGTVLFGRMQAGAQADRVLGLFINTLPLRVDVSTQGIAHSLQQVHERLVQLLRHEHAPLALAQRCSAVPAQAPLFTALLNYRYSAQAEQGGHVLHGLQLVGGHERTNYPLALAVDDLGGGITLTAQARAPLSPHRVCAFMQAALAQLAQALQHAPAQATNTLDVMPDAEREHLLHAAADSALPVPQATSLHVLFEAQVLRSPHAPALIEGEHHMSFAELDRRANQLAHHLQAQGVGRGTLVGLAVERGMDVVVGLLAILKAGGAYLPLDPAYPPARLAHMLADAKPALVLTQSAVQPRLPQGGVPTWAMDTQWHELAARPTTAPSPSAHTPDDLAYVIYTSGSTGTPKGVMVEHRNVVNLWAALEWAVFRHHPQCRRVSLNAPIAFDASVQQWVQLLSGRALVVVPEAVRRDSVALRRFLAEQAVDAFDCTPSQLALLLDAPDAGRWPEVVLVGGEAVSPALWRQLAAQPQGRAYNVYGPTECTVDSTCAPVQGDTPHIGHALANAQVYLLDEALRPVPAGVAGELWITGEGVARGYLNRADLTAERFVPCPFRPGQRMYKTGDLGRRRADGAIDYLGRNDFQVKLRGFRIELGEIEACLAQVPGVKEVAVLAREDQPGDQRLVAYYVCESGAEATPELLRAQAADRLPAYMVPTACLPLPHWPLTPSGKLDRQALPAPERQGHGGQPHEAPQGPVEEALAALWSELLQVRRIGRSDHFFELGGHSLLAVQLVSRLRRQLQVELPLADLFEHPRLDQLARRVEAAAPARLGAMPRADRSRPLPVSLAQQRLWFLSQMEGGSQAYHISGTLQLQGPLDVQALQRALHGVVQRHEALRTQFALHEGQPVQQVSDAVPQVELQDLRTQADAPAVARQWEQAHAARRFDLALDLPVRVLLLRLADEQHRLHVVMHHIASDGWSVGLFLRELGTLYSAFVAGQADPLPPLQAQYADYAAWQRAWLAEGQAPAAAFWRDTLQGAPSLLELPTDRGRPAEQDYAGASIELQLGKALSARLGGLSQRHGVTLYMTLLAAWATLLGRLAGQHEVVVGSPVAGRQRAEVEPLVGFFVNTLPMRVSLAGEPSVAALLQRTKALVLAAQQHQALPFDQIVEAVNPPRSLAHAPLFQVMFDWHNTPAAQPVLHGLQVALQPTEQATAQFDLTLSLQDTDQGVAGTLNYATALFDERSVQAWARSFVRLLEAMTDDDAQPVARLAWLDDAQRRQLLTDWNDTTQPLPLHRCAHELFEAQAARAPQHLAVDDGTQQLSYAQLDEQANRLARHLRGLGVGPDTPVALCAERGATLVMALLAILKAGGAYLPLDRDYPADRIAYMLQDGRPAVLLCTPATREGVLPCVPAGLPVVDLVADAAHWAGLPAGKLPVEELGLTPGHLAYVIYTSGSTGRPKGVMVEHRGLVNYSLDAVRWFGLTPADRVLQQNSLNFDLSIEEMLPALLAGATLVPSDTLFGLQEGQHPGRPTMVHFTAAHWHSLVGEWSRPGARAAERLAGVRMVNVTGDALSNGKLAEWERLKPATTGLVNTYGPTEITVSCSAAYVRHAPQAHRVSIGRPFANTRLYILDAYLEPVPVGVAGELYIGGVGVARGYLNLPRLTEERFLPDPFVAEGRMYKTGDLARWRADGEVEYIGRNDFQVKVRGFRIELGEVESVLARTPGVQEVVVLAREDEPGEKRLVAYFTGTAEAAAMRHHAALHLPGYMQPAACVALERLPLTPNGKLDRAALPAPDTTRADAQAFEAPQGEREQLLAGLWAELLKLERVGRHDNFFELGGHSLLAVSLIERMRGHGLQADVRSLFITPTVAQLAAQSGAAERPVVQVPPNLIPGASPAAAPTHELEEFRL